MKISFKKSLKRHETKKNYWLNKDNERKAKLRINKDGGEKKIVKKEKKQVNKWPEDQQIIKCYLPCCFKGGRGDI